MRVEAAGADQEDVAEPGLVALIAYSECGQLLGAGFGYARLLLGAALVGGSRRADPRVSGKRL